MVEEAFDLLGDEIAVIHAKDFIVEGKEIVSMPSGQGQFHYEPLMKKIKEEKPFIHVLLEDTKPENVFAARDFMKQKYAEV
jgi:sugar phosphate isomerase/epimerase